MAYESIYQVSLTPLTPDDYIDEEMFYEDFVGHYATYVDDSADQTEGIKRLKQELGEAAKWDGNSFKIIDKEKIQEIDQFTGKSLSNALSSLESNVIIQKYTKNVKLL